jgi:hypothetical protein
MVLLGRFSDYHCRGVVLTRRLAFDRPLRWDVNTFVLSSLLGKSGTVMRQPR